MEYDISTQQATSAGFSRVWYGRRSEMTTIAQLPAAPTTPAEEVTIGDDHVFDTGKGFKQLFFDEDKSEVTAEQVGGKYSKGGKTIAEIFIPGKHPELIAWLKAKEDLIFLIEDSSCGSGSENPIQIGTNCSRVSFDETSFKGENGSSEEDPGITISISSKQDSILLFYGGTITEPA